MCTTIITQWVFLVALANLGRDRPCKQPKGQALFFLVDDGYPEMLAALGAEEVRDIREGTMLEAFVTTSRSNCSSSCAINSALKITRSSPR